MTIVADRKAHVYKGGRHRPEKASVLGVTPRGTCVVCGRPKAAHFEKAVSHA